MKRTKTNSTPIDQLFDVVSQCLTPELAKKILAIKADDDYKARMLEFADRCNEGELTPDEYAEYGMYVGLGTQLSTLKSQARLLLSRAADA